ncbi:conserved oligomeric golgi complex component 2 like protein [Babesia gibsoni]|uniref:Conserved oligomeric golgi complex component 2 like protein n=1 Tax=Babesia gibsoni TaxID=33632 RepID=A0AAD8LNR9_BABGI|nr:conserved oligomeric golgi complex component 2 like protein [Babesia gibsoni]
MELTKAAHRVKPAVVDSAKNLELYNETLEQLKSIKNQVRSPGEYVASRLEFVGLDDIRRELKALLASCESQASGLLKSLFINASPFNDTIESTINAILPLKEQLEDSAKELDATRNATKAIHRDVQLYLCRYAMVLYAKVAISTHIEAAKHLDNMADEVVDCFIVYCKGDISKRDGDAVARAELMVKNIAKSVESQKPILKAGNVGYSLVTNWSLLELLPKEISRVKVLLKRCRHYEATIARLLEDYSSILQQGDPEMYKSQLNILSDMNRSNAEKVLEIEKMIDSTDVSQFRAEYDVQSVEERAHKLHLTCVMLTDICAHTAITKLFDLYIERDKVINGEKCEGSRIENITREIDTYVTGLSSLIKGAEQLRKHPGSGGHPYKREAPFVSLFSKLVVKPILHSKVNILPQKDGEFMKAMTPQDEMSIFPSFVERALQNLLDPTRSITMCILNDVTKSSGNDRFKVACLFDAIALDLLNHIEKRFSSIYFPIYMDQFKTNYKAYERLLEAIELASGDYAHYLKWRGAVAPKNVSNCFSIGVICDNFIEEVKAVFFESLNVPNGTSVTLFTTSGVSFYEPPSKALHDQVHALFSDEIFYHLMPQYLRGLSEMFAEYVNYISRLVPKEEASSRSADKDDTSSSGVSITSATYVLHDLDIMVNAFKTGTVDSIGVSVNGEPLSGSDESKEAATLESNNKPEDPSSFKVDMVTCYDGELVKLVTSKIDFPLQIAFKRILYATCRDNTVTNGAISTAREVLEAYWSGSKNLDKGHPASQFAEYGISPVDHDDLTRLINFTKESVGKLYKFFGSLYEELDSIKYSLEDFIIGNLFTSASCSLQFLQSMPSKFRSANNQQVTKSSNYVKYLIVPLTSFKEFTTPTLSNELQLKIMTQTISRISAEYRSQVMTLLQTVQNLNQSLLNSKNQKVKEQGANYLIADIDMIKEQLRMDIQEYISQCESRLEMKYELCEDLKRLNMCLQEG